MSNAATGSAVRRRCSAFFFQAEDGIRDLTVTGVQTCALPISWGLVATVEGLYTKNLDVFFYADRNLAGPIGVDPHGRSMYGTFGNNGLATPTLDRKSVV